MPKLPLGTKLVLFVFPLCLVLCVVSGLAQTATPGKVTVKVNERSELTLAEADLRAMPRHTVEANEHGTIVTYGGVLLHDVLERAGAPLGKDLKGKALSSYVLATANDGYAVTYTLTEMDTAFSEGDVLLADESGGQALKSPQGPFRLVAPHDKKPARSLRMLERIDVVQLRK
jgi:hypothetical protein